MRTVKLVTLKSDKRPNANMILIARADRGGDVFTCHNTLLLPIISYKLLNERAY